MAFVTHAAPLPTAATRITSTSTSTRASAPTGAFVARTRAATLHAAASLPAPSPHAAARTPPPAMVAFSQNNVAIVTGASSSIGLHAAYNLANRGDHHVVLAVRNTVKARLAAEELGLPQGSYTILPLDLSRLESVRAFAQMFNTMFPKLNVLVCNAAIWHPRDKKPRFTVDGYDETVQVNHLGHFLLANLLLPKVKMTKGRIVFLATQTHNPDTLPGKIPPQADLGNLEGLTSGFKTLPGTIDGKKFEPTKAYKDSKVCNVLTMREMHRRFATDGVTVSAIFPGCIASSELFREKRGWFRLFFPLFQKFVTRQFVSVEEAGRRVAMVASDGQFGDSGTYWQWRGSYLEGIDNTTPVPIQPTERESAKADELWGLSAKLVGLPV